MFVLMKIIIIIIVKCSSKNVQINNMNMEYYDAIDVSEGIGVNNTSATKERIVCHYWCFLDEGLS